MLRRKERREESRTKKQPRHRRCLSCMRPQMADNRNPCSEAAVAVGAREGLTISRWASESFLAPSALVNVLFYELLFIFGDTLLDKVPPGGSVLRNMFPGLRFYFTPFKRHLEGILIPLSRPTTRPVLQKTPTLEGDSPAFEQYAQTTEAVIPLA